jgi:hypothetical protein
MNTVTAEDRIPEPELDANGLYREDLFTDLKVGSIRRLVPVTADGSTDAARPVLYVGQASLLTPMGTLPLSFEIEAASLEDALRKYPAAGKAAIERTVQELQEMRREAASQLIVPQGGASALQNQPGLIGGGGSRIRRP